MPQIYTIDSYAQPRKSVQIAMPPPLAKRQQSDPNSSGGQSSELPTRNGPEWLCALWDWSSEKWANLQEKLLICRKKNGQMSIRDKIHPRYLEFEPLCCLSSCLVREGCYSVAAFEVFHFVFTTFIIAMKIYDGGKMNFWDDLDEWNFNAIVTHQFFLYILLLFNLVTLGMAVALAFGLASFERVFIKIHWRFDFISLAFNFIVFILYSFALSSDGPQTWGWANVFLMLAIAAHIPVQIWAIFVVKSCYDFFVLLYVFVSLAEK